MARGSSSTREMGLILSDAERYLSDEPERVRRLKKPTASLDKPRRSERPAKQISQGTEATRQEADAQLREMSWRRLVTARSGPTVTARGGSPRSSAPTGSPRCGPAFRLEISRSSSTRLTDGPVAPNLIGLD